MKLTSGKVGGKSMKGWIRVFVTIIIAFIIAIILMNIGRWITLEAYKKQFETTEKPSDYNGNLFNPFDIGADIYNLLDKMGNKSTVT